MRPPDTFRAVVIVFRAQFSTLALCCVAILSSMSLTACGYSCLTATWNFNGTVSTGNGACSTSPATGNVSLRMTSTAPSTDAPMAPNFLHVFISIQGIEAHPSATAGENSPGWEELAPDLVKEPMQIDLMATAKNYGTSNSFGDALITAGPYRQTRLRLIPNHPAVDVAVPKQNACGEIGFQCVVTSDGSMRPLMLDEAAPDLLIPSDRIAGGLFTVLPDANTNLTLEFNPYASVAAPSGESVRIVPVFTVNSIASSDSLQASQR